MGLRFPILASLYIIAILAANDSSIGLISDVTGVIAALVGLLILSVAALWPNASRADRVDRRVDGSSWADRIDIESIGRQRTDHDR